MPKVYCDNISTRASTKIQSKDRYSSIYIPNGESISDRYHREELEEENVQLLKLKTHTIDELCLATGTKKVKIIEALRWLIDEGKAIRDGDFFRYKKES